MTETIELIVKVKINYPDRSKRKKAIETAKQNAKSVSTLGDIGSIPKSAKLYIEKPDSIIYKQNTYIA